MPLWGFVVCFITATLWAASPILVHRGLSEESCEIDAVNPIRSISFLFFSFLILLFMTKGDFLVVTDPRVLMYIALNVFLGYTVGDLLFFASIRLIGVSLAVPIANAYPILVTLTSWMILGERVSAQVFFGVAIVVAGLIALRLGAPREEEESPLEKRITPAKSKLLKGFLLALATTVAWSLSAPINKYVLNLSGMMPVELTFYRACAFFVISWAIHFGRILLHKGKGVTSLRSVSRKAWLYFFAAAAVGLCLGSILYTTCLRVMPVAIVTAITSTSPFMAALYGHFVIKERLTLVQWSGVTLIIAGSIAVSL